MDMYPVIDPETGKLSPAVIPAGGGSGGGAGEVAFAFAGDLTVKVGDFLWCSPDAEIRPIRATVTLGRTPSPDVAHESVFRLRVDGDVLATLTLTGTNQVAATATFDLASILAAKTVTAEVVSLTAHAPVVQGHALVQLWWEYV